MFCRLQPEAVCYCAWALLPFASVLHSAHSAVPAGYNPLESYGVPYLTPHVAAALGKLMTACHTLYGFSRITSMNKCVFVAHSPQTHGFVCCQGLSSSHAHVLGIQRRPSAGLPASA